ncbi:MAG: trypsin-like peptidase domain-containing protein [Bdellovibrionaceae bacterium]|jgi:serine protease Do|nr:trypsin-like peptidase domain-containing protein [Pseudobdellovibrionaceae bacterium]
MLKTHLSSTHRVIALIFPLTLLLPQMALSQNFLQDAFIELAKKINPAVVNISTEFMPRGRMYRDPFLDMLEQFYGFRLQPRAKPQTALGTGFVIREDGLMITNHHVINGADKIQVQFEEKGKMFEAKLIGSDERSDIALLKIKGDKFPTLKLGDSDKVQVGEWVAAFGNPFGNGHTMTKGIISAIGRDISEINKYPLLQTDAPINPGNSGGPLVNLRGEVIGVNSAIDARAQGIGFAIPINGVKKLIPDLEKEGRVRKGYLGVGLVDLDMQNRALLGLGDEVEGVIIAQVEKGSPAAQAGLQAYDVVTEFNGRKVSSSTELIDAVSDAEIGKSTDVKVLREGKKLTLKITPTERPGALGRLKNRFLGPQPTAPTHQEWGFSVTELDKDLRQEYQIPEDIKGVIIVHVLPGSPAARGGLMVGDVIMDINKKGLASVKDLTKLLKDKESNILRIYRSGSVLFLSLKK